MTYQQYSKVDRKKVKTLKRELGPTLNTPEGCLDILRRLIFPDVNYPNPVSVAVRDRFYGLMRRSRGNGNGHYNRKACLTMYRRIIEDIINHPQRAGEDYRGEYSWRGTPQRKTRDITTRQLNEWGIHDES